MGRVLSVILEENNPARSRESEQAEWEEQNKQFGLADAEDTYSGSQPGMVLPHRGHPAMSGDVFSGPVGAGGVTSI